jgi:hypothetical protein
MLRPEECALIRAYEPRGAHEHAMLAQLPEFYSDDPSAELLRSIAQDVARATEEERHAMGRAVVADLCPEIRHARDPGVSIGTGLNLLIPLMLLMLLVLVALLITSAPRPRLRPKIITA